MLKILKSMPRKFLQDIYLEYFVMFGASSLLLVTDTTQPSQSCMALVICQKMAALRIEWFPCNHSVSAVLTGFNSN